MKNAKNIVLTLITLFFISNISIAQTDNGSRTKLQFGAKVGANYSNIYDSESNDFKADGRLGFAGGVFASIPLGKYLGIQPEILFSQKGFQSTGTILGQKYESSRTTNYIDVPLLVAIKPISIITILLGPQYSYLLSQKDVFTSSIYSSAQETEFAKDNIRTNTLCFTGGVDVNINHIVVSARAGWDFQNNRGDGNPTTPRYKNAWYQATIGYRF